MNTYLVPICDVQEVNSYFEVIHANDFETAKKKLSDKVIKDYINIMKGWSDQLIENFKECSFSELRREFMYVDIIIGDIYEISEFLNE